MIKYKFEILDNIEFMEFAVGWHGDECMLYHPDGKCRTRSFGRTVSLNQAILEQYTNEKAEPGMIAYPFCGKQHCANPRHLKWMTSREMGKKSLEVWAKGV